ncbi:MAG: DUF2231 domain-containing protein [Polyangiales bacterium]
MDSLPLHPAIVHLPVALAVLVPLVAGGALVAALRGASTRRTFAGVALAQALLLGSGFAAKATGEREEETVERVVPESALEAHEEAADVFLVGAGVTLLLFLAAAAAPEKAARALAGAGLVGSLVVLGLGYRVGEAGGELVYRHGAASAYVTAASTGGAAAAEPGGGESGDDD